MGRLAVVQDARDRPARTCRRRRAASASGAVVGPGVSIPDGTSVAGGRTRIPGGCTVTDGLRGDVRAGRPARRPAPRGPMPRRRHARGGARRAAGLGDDQRAGRVAPSAAAWPRRSGATRCACRRSSAAAQRSRAGSDRATSWCPCPTAEPPPRRSQPRRRRWSEAPTSSPSPRASRSRHSSSAAGGQVVRVARRPAAARGARLALRGARGRARARGRGARDRRRDPGRGARLRRGGRAIAAAASRASSESRSRRP